MGIDGFLMKPASIQDIAREVARLLCDREGTPENGTGADAGD